MLQTAGFFQKARDNLGPLAIPAGDVDATICQTVRETRAKNPMSRFLVWVEAPKYP